VSQWGQDFRQSYLKLNILKKHYPDVPFLCLTATATPLVKEDIIKRLELNHVMCFQSSFNRPNLDYEIRTMAVKDINDDIVKLLRHRFNGLQGIIYCHSKK
jgi:superfamily II DNA helicase RecQ